MGGCCSAQGLESHLQLQEFQLGGEGDARRVRVPSHAQDGGVLRAELRVRRELHQLRMEPEAGLWCIGERVTARALRIVPVGKGRSRQ